MREKRYEELVPYVEQAKQGSGDAFAYLYEATIEPTRYFVYNFCKNRNRWKIFFRKSIWKCTGLCLL